MWTVCITSISHVLKLNGYGGRQAKVNEKRLCFKGWETLVSYILVLLFVSAQALCAQTTRTITGRVVDVNNTPLIGATISA